MTTFMTWANQYWTPGNLVGLGAAMATWVGLWVVSLANQQKPPDTSGAGRKDSRSLAGIIVQGLGIGVAWFGRMRFAQDVSETAWIAAAPTIAVAVLSLLLFWWSVATMGKNWAVVAQTRGDHQLVQTGPFAFIRNPIYVAICGMMIATAMALGHAWNLIVAIPVYVVGTMMRVGLEEKLLGDTFGAAYAAYRRRVKRFIPAIW